MHRIIRSTKETFDTENDDIPGDSKNSIRKEFIQDLHNFDKAIDKEKEKFQSLIPLKQKLEHIGAQNKVESHIRVNLKDVKHGNYKRYCDIASMYRSSRKYSFISKE